MGTHSHDGAAKAIRAELPAARVAERYGFPPNRAGYICCPFHKEKTPSLKLYPGDKGWHCFGCGKGGDVIRFVMEIFDITFPQAITRISADFGLALCGDRPSHAARSQVMEERRQRQRDLEALEEQRRTLLGDFRYYFEVDKYFTPVQDGWNAYFHPLWAEAQQKLPALEYQIDELDDQIRTLKRQ